MSASFVASKVLNAKIGCAKRRISLTGTSRSRLPT
jgi:hypothetical protein